MGFIRKISNPADVSVLKVHSSTFPPPKGQKVIPVYSTQFNELIDYVQELELEVTGDILRNLFDGTTGSICQTGGNKVLGDYNAVFGDDSTVTGGYNLVGGYNHSVPSGEHYNFLAGSGNSTDGDFNGVVGYNNGIVGDLNLVGGTSNGVNGSKNIVGGDGNTIASGEHLNIVSGELNYVDGDDNAIFGRGNTALGNYNFVVGSTNEVLDGEGNNLVGGGSNVVDGDYNIVGGYDGEAKGNYNLISGNSVQLAAGSNGDIVGGLNQSVNGSYNIVSGNGNTVTADLNVVNGYGNDITGDANLVVATATNVVGERCLAVGSSHDVDANFCNAFGSQHVLAYDHQSGFGVQTKPSPEGFGLAFSDSAFSSAGDNQHEFTHMYADITSTGPATATSPLYVGGTNEILCPTGAIERVDVWWAAVQYAGDSGPTGTVQSAHDFALIENVTGTVSVTDGGSTDPLPAADWGSMGFVGDAGKWHCNFTIVGDRDVRVTAKVQIVRLEVP